MSDSNSSNDNNNGNYFKSSYNTFSKVCRTDPENLNQQICKETINENGKIKEKEYIVPLRKSNYTQNEPRKLINRSEYDNNNTNNSFFNNLKYVISNVFSGNKNDKNDDNKRYNNKYEFQEENDRDRKKNSNNNSFNRTINEYHNSSNNINFPNFSNTRDSFFSDINDFVKFEGKILKII